MPTLDHPVEPKCSVLVVDDDELSREVISFLLAADGYDVRSVGSGEEAISLLSAMSSPTEMPSLVLTDLRMPGLAGKPLAESLRTVCGPSVRLLVMSAGNPNPDQVAAYDGFLHKPLSVDALGRALHRVEQSEGRTSVPRDREGAWVLDESIYRKLANSMSQGQLREVYGFCLRDALQRLERMRLSVQVGDEAALRREAHTLQGGSGMLGAAEIRAFAGSLETLRLSTRTTSELDHLLDGLAVACERLRSMLEARWREDP